MSSTPRRGAVAVPVDQRQSAILNRRISSLYHTSVESCAVFEIGSRLLRAGLSGEHAPRCTLSLPEPSTHRREKLDKRLVDQNCDLLEDDFLGEYEDMIDKVAREAINRYLYVSLKGKKVILVESHYLPIKIKRIMARIFFTYYQPREVSFMPASICSLLALGVKSGIVVNLGVDESTVVPVFDSRPLNNLVRSTALGFSAMSRRMQYLLEANSNPPLSDLLRSDLEDFLATALVCLPRSPLLPDISELILDQALEDSYNTGSYKSQRFEWCQPSTQKKTMLPTWIRFAITEILFETRGIYAEVASTSITSCIMAAHKSANIDLREPLNQICVTGGLCQIPGIQQRIRTETGLKVLQNQYATDLAWTGASLAAALKLDGQTVTVQHFNSTSKVPDWSRQT